MKRKRIIVGLGLVVALITAAVVVPWVRGHMLIRELRGAPDPSRRIEVIDEIGRARVSWAVPALVDVWLENARQPDVREAIREAVAAIGARGTSHLAELAHDLEQTTALAAIDLIGRSGRHGRGALRALVALLESDSPHLRADAIWAIARVGPACGPERRSELAESVARFVEDEHWRVRTRARWAVAVLRG